MNQEKLLASSNNNLERKSKNTKRELGRIREKIELQYHSHSIRLSADRNNLKDIINGKSEICSNRPEAETGRHRDDGQNPDQELSNKSNKAQSTYPFRVKNIDAQ